MPTPDELSLRVLDALVEEFVRTGRPVPISLILERTEPAVSATELEDCLSHLEAERLVERAGGSVEYIPTHQGYDYHSYRSRPKGRRGANRRRHRQRYPPPSRELRAETTALGCISGVGIVVLAGIIGGTIVVFAVPVLFVVGTVVLVSTRRQTGGFLRGMGCSFVIGAFLFVLVAFLVLAAGMSPTF